MDKDFLVAKICSGIYRVSYIDKTYEIIPPSPKQIFKSYEIRDEVFEQAILDGAYTDDEVYDLLVNKELWTEEDAKMLETLPKDIEEWKFKMFKAAFKSYDRETFRKGLNIARNKLIELSSKRYQFNHLTCKGIAEIARLKYLAGCGLRYRGKRVLGGNYEFWPSQFLESIVHAHTASRLTESQIRLLARTEPWRTIWSSRKACSAVFAQSAITLTDEQRHLVTWTSLYDSVFEHPDCPSDEVLEDDDLMDGWLIDQRRQREERADKRAGESLLNNEKLRNADEVYVPVQSMEDAKKIAAMNSEHAKNIKRQRLDLIKEKGVVNELDMPDTKRKLHVAAAQKFANNK